MSETAVRVDLRQANLSESAKLREAEDHVFIALEQPPPVRSLLRLTIGEERKAFEVQRVVEVASDDEPARGCYGSFVDVERLEEQTKVGSEHLQPGNVGGGGVPAPVVIMTTEEMMLGEAGSEESEAAAAAAAGAELGADVGGAVGEVGLEGRVGGGVAEVAEGEGLGAEEVGVAGDEDEAL